MRMARQAEGDGLAHVSVPLPAAVVFILGSFFLGNLGMIFISRSSYKPASITSMASRRGEVLRSPDDGNYMKIGEDGCDTIQDYNEDGDYNNIMIKEDPWRQTKWALPPAKCRVNGHLIDRLDPLYNYRRGVALDFTNDLDDRVPMEQWFLGTKVDFNKRHRRVLIDLGANAFATSVVWLQQRYPCDFTEVHAFEADPTLFRIPAGFDEDKNWQESPSDGSFFFRKIKGREPGNMPQWMVNRIHPYNKLVGLEDDLEQGKINITRFIKDELKLTADDAVVVKMDIEGSEWPILESWLKDPDMPKIIDELLVEMHYSHADNRWMFENDRTREETNLLLATLRFQGWYAHYWN